MLSLLPIIWVTPCESLKISYQKAVGAGTPGTAGAIPLFQDNNVIVFILQYRTYNMQLKVQKAGEHIPRLLVY